MTKDEFAEIVARMVVRATETYSEPRQRAALRCALGDAAALCDALAKRVEEANTSRRRVTQVGAAMAGVARSCADEISAMRDMIHVSRET